jgi:hypothetical protein
MMLTPLLAIEDTYWGAGAWRRADGWNAYEAESIHAALQAYSETAEVSADFQVPVRAAWRHRPGPRRRREAARP